MRVEVVVAVEIIQVLEKAAAEVRVVFVPQQVLLLLLERLTQLQ